MSQGQMRLSFVIDGDSKEAVAAVRQLAQEVEKSGGRLETLAPKANQAFKEIHNGALLGKDATRLASYQLNNLQFQLQDMATGLVSGQSPFVIMMQQGGQIAQLFQPGTGIMAALKSVGAGLGTFLLNPLNLATLGFGLALTAGISFFNSITEAGGDAEEVLKRHEDLLKRIGAAYDASTGKVKAWGLESKALLAMDAARDTADTKTLLLHQLDRFWSRDATGGMRMGGSSITAFGGTLWGKGGATMGEVEATGNRELINLVRSFGGAIEGFRRGQNDLDFKGFMEKLAQVQKTSSDEQVKAIAQAIRDSMGGFAREIADYQAARSAARELSGNPIALTEELFKTAEKGILDLIGRTEGTDRGRGYNETLGYGKFTGGPVELVTMKISEVLDLQKRMLAHPENTFNSSAVGRYQITRKTLLDIMPELGLKGDTIFSKEVQDKIALTLANRTGGNIEKLGNTWTSFQQIQDKSVITTAWDKSSGGRSAAAAEVQKAAQAEKDWSLALKDRLEALKQSTTGLGFATEAQIRERRETELLALAHRKFGEALTKQQQDQIKRQAAEEAATEVKNRATAADEKWGDALAKSRQALGLMTDATGQGTLAMARARKETELLAQAHAIYGDSLAPGTVAAIKAEAQAWGEQAAAAKKAGEQTRANAEAQRDQIRQMDLMRETFGGLASSFFQAREQGESWGQSLSSVLDHVKGKVLSLLDTLIDNLLFGQKGTSGGGLLGGLLGNLGSLLFPQAASPGVYALGGAFGGGVQAFAGGAAFTNGVFDRPTLFRFGGKLGVMGEAGPEAVLPLVRGRGGLSVMAAAPDGERALPLTRLPSGKLGVQAFADGDVFGAGIAAARAPAGGGQVTINHTVKNYGSETVKSTSRQNSDGSIDIETMVGNAVNRHIARGGADPALTGRFTGLNRRLERHG